LATQLREDNEMTETGSAAPSKRASVARPPSASATGAADNAAVGAVSGVIAALVGAYFGIRGASLAQINSESGGGTPPKTKT
jgi:hypothetical protein